jgi:hypothetical protein
MADDKVVISIESENNTKKGIDSAEKSFKGLSSTVTKLAAAGFGIAAIKSFGEAMLDANVEAQKLNASLVSVTGSQAAASRAFKNLSDFATRTPFQLNQVVQAFIKMKSLGLDATEESLMSFGNTASAMGKDLNQMIEAVADASTGEFERLKEFGIKARSEGENVSFTFQGVTTTVGKNAAEITEFLKGIGETKFGDAMSEQMKTLGGAVSNAEDSWNKFLIALGESGVADAAAAALSVVTTALNQLSEAMDPTIQGRVKDLTNELVLLEDQLAEATQDGTRDGGDFAQTLQAKIDEKSAELDALRAEVVKEKELAATEAMVKPIVKTPEELAETKKQEEDVAVGNELDELQRQLQAQQAIDAVLEEQQLMHNAAMVAAYDADVAASKQAAQTKADNDRIAMQAGMGALADLSGLMNSESKKAFEVGKAASIAQATISTYQGATSAFAALAPIPLVGPALGTAAAAAAVVAGLANIQSIASTKFGGGGGKGAAVPSSIGGTAAAAQPVGQPTAAIPGQRETADIRVEGNSVLAVIVEEQIIPALNQARSRGVDLVLT